MMLQKAKYKITYKKKLPLTAEAFFIMTNHI